MGRGFELLLIAVIVLLLFGTKKLKNLGSDLGGAIKGFRSELDNKELEEERAKRVAAEKKLMDVQSLEGEASKVDANHKTDTQA